MRKMKVVLIALCAVLVVSLSIIGTVAYLTDTTAVVNTFTVGQVDIRLDEATVDENGNPTGERTEKGNTYRLVPGRTYTKDPTVTVVAGSEESYVRMLVTVNCYEELTAIFGDPFLPQYFVEGWDSTVWLTTNTVSKDEANNTATYEFRYYASVKPAAESDLVLDALFDSVTVPESMTGDQLASIAGLEITVEGHAIQKSGFTDADAAWVAFQK